MMKARFYTPRLLALICLAAILFAAVIEIVPGLLLVFLIPVWFFFAAVVSVPIASAHEGCASPVHTPLPIFSPRPPPIS
jgi:hypothetical protein